MKLLYATTSIAILICACDNSNARKTESSTPQKQSAPEVKIDPFANIDDPSLYVCSANIGNVKYNEDGDFIGSKQPIKAILKLLKNSKCEEIKVSYVSDLGEGERYPIDWIYNTKITEQPPTKVGGFVQGTESP